MSDATPPSNAPTPPPVNPGSYNYQNTARTNTLAIITIIAAFVLPLAGIITGHIALGQIRRTGEQGTGLAKAGLILSYVFTAIGLVVIILWIIFAVAIIGAGTTITYS